MCNKTLLTSQYNTTTNNHHRAQVNNGIASMHDCIFEDNAASYNALKIYQVGGLCIRSCISLSASAAHLISLSLSLSLSLWALISLSLSLGGSYPPTIFLSPLFFSFTKGHRRSWHHSQRRCPRLDWRPRSRGRGFNWDPAAFCLPVLDDRAGGVWDCDAPAP